MNTEAIRMAAHIFSVKGSFKIQNNSIYIVLTQTHKDILETFHQYFGGYIRTEKRGNRKDLHIWRLYGDAAIGLMMSIYTLLPTRRQNEIKKCIQVWKIAAASPDMAGFSIETWDAWGRDSGFKNAKEMLVSMYKEYNHLEIAEIIGVSQTTISTKLRELGVTRPKQFISKVKIESIQRRYKMLDGNISWSRLGRQLGVSRYLAEKYAKGSL